MPSLTHGLLLQGFCLKGNGQIFRTKWCWWLQGERGGDGMRVRRRSRRGEGAGSAGEEGRGSSGVGGGHAIAERRLGNEITGGKGGSK